MKPIMKMLLVCLSLYSGISFSSCKKDKAPAPVCRIITATSSASDVHNISYRSDGKINSIISGTSTTTFVYNGDSAIATTNVSGNFNTKKIITFNAQGMTTNVRAEYNGAGTVWDNSAYEYANGTELIKITTTSSSGGTPQVSTATWANGNLVTVSSGGSNAIVEYYTDIPEQPGDYWSLSELITGANINIYKTKNAVKRIAVGTSITSFDYTITDGKITALTATGSSNVIFIYQHQCN